MINVFEQVRERLKTVHKTSKDHYDQGAAERNFHPGDKVRIKLKSVGKQLTKLDAPWSIPYEIHAIQGPVLELNDAEKRENNFNVHSDKVIAVKPNLRTEPQPGSVTSCTPSSDSERDLSPESI